MIVFQGWIHHQSMKMRTQTLLTQALILHSTSHVSTKFVNIILQFLSARKEEQEPEIKSRTSSLLQLMGSVTGLSSLKGEEEAETDMSEINSDQSSITADIPDEQQPEILRKNTPGRAPTLPGTVKEYCSIFCKEQ